LESALSLSINKTNETAYLEFTQLNIELRDEELKQLSKQTMQASINPHTAGAVRRTFEDRELPSVNNPYFMRIDLVDGKTLYYGFLTLTQADQSPAIPKSHPGVDRWLILGKDQDGKGYTSLGSEELQDLVARTRFTIKNGQLIEIQEEQFESGTAKDRVIAPDFVKKALKETREEYLQPIGATLQPDQFRLSRESADHFVAIQGPPGSGKTAVLLERLARIAFANPEIREKGMLLIGPNPHFLEYVSQVLPAMGKSDVLLSTVSDLVAWKPTYLDESEFAKEIKGHPVMVQLLEAVVNSLPRIIERNIELKVLNLRVEFSVMDSVNLRQEIYAIKGNYVYKKSFLESRLRDILVDKFMASWDETGVTRKLITIDPALEIINSKQFKSVLNRMLPQTKPTDILRKLKDSPSYFYDIAKELLSDDQIQNWIENASTPSHKLSESDLPLLDYLQFLLEGKPKSWGHIAIDETQDLSPMELRVISNRLADNSSISLTGDLAQATGTFFYRSWEGILEELGRNSNYTVRELTRSYRVPSSVIEYANQFLVASGIQVSGAIPFMDDVDSLNKVVAKSSDELLRMAIEIAQASLSDEQSVIILAPKSILEEISRVVFLAQGKAQIRTMKPSEIKGLESDVVVIIDPAQILEEMYPDQEDIERPARMMYVMSTRSTRRLHILGMRTDELDDPLISYRRSPKQDIEPSQDIDSETANLPEVDTEKLIIDIEELIKEWEELAADEKSVAELCEKFGMKIVSSNERFSTGSWFFLGLTQEKCVNCGLKPQHIFRRHYISDRQGIKTVYHYWAIVCGRCNTILDGTSYSREALNRISIELDAEKSILESCKNCDS
jgi:DNA helicase IV